VAQSGLPGYEAVLWQAVFAPAGVPPALLARLSADLARVRDNPEARERLKASGVDVFPLDATQFGAFFRAETEKWQKVIRTAGIKLE
jgi:tripartite-type tricarboxylate transporter receptor subunit TctC